MNNRASSSSTISDGRTQPKHLVVFLAQVIVAATAIVAAIYNLSTTDTNQTLWTSILSANIGYLLPNPSLKRRPWIVLPPSTLLSPATPH